MTGALALVTLFIVLVIAVVVVATWAWFAAFPVLTAAAAVAPGKADRPEEARGSAEGTPREEEEPAAAVPGV